MRALQARNRVRHEHETPSDRHRVHAVRCELQHLAVVNAKLDIVQPKRGRFLARKRNHLRYVVHGDHMSGRTHSFGRRNGRLPRAASDVQHV